VPVDGRAGPLHGEPRLIHIAAERQISPGGNRIDSCGAARHFQLVLWRAQALFMEPTKRTEALALAASAAVELVSRDLQARFQC
jgi:hypothetical protein